MVFFCPPWHTCRPSPFSSILHTSTEEMSQLSHLVTHPCCDSLTFGSFVVSLICSFLSLNTTGQPCSVILSVLSHSEQDKHVQRQETHSNNIWQARASPRNAKTCDDGKARNNKERVTGRGNGHQWLSGETFPGGRIHKLRQRARRKVSDVLWWSALHCTVVVCGLISLHS